MATAGRSRDLHWFLRTTRDKQEALISLAGGESPKWEPTVGGLQQELYDLLDEQRRDELRSSSQDQAELDRPKAAA